MTRIDFYVLDQDGEQQQFRYACRLAEKAWKAGHRIHILTASPEASHTLDALLWSFRPDAFVPHAISPAGKSTPIHISHERTDAIHHSLLINLQTQLPDHFSQFERLAEIVTNAPDALNQGRDKFRFYRDRGYEIHDHRIKLGSAT